MEKIIIIGGGGQAKSVISVIKKTKQYEILGYVAPENEGDVSGVAYLGQDKDLSDIRERSGCYKAALGVGHVHVPNKREEIAALLMKSGFEFPTIVSPDAIVNEHATIGEGTVVFDGAIVNVDVIVGKYCIINTGSIIDHDSRIGSNVHIAPGATLSGGVQVGDNSIVGVGASVIQYKEIGKDCIIGAGAVVINDCLEAGTYVGIPARK